MNQKPFLLYVDDEPFNLLLLKRLLKDHYDVITAASGLEGLEKLSSESGIKAVISDMKMPGMNGVEFISKGKKEYPHIVFFILTGYDRTPEITEVLKNNLISAYFSKPLNVKNILETLGNALK